MRFEASPILLISARAAAIAASALSPGATAWFGHPSGPSVLARSWLAVECGRAAQAAGRAERRIVDRGRKRMHRGPCGTQIRDAGDFLVGERDVLAALIDEQIDLQPDRDQEQSRNADQACANGEPAEQSNLPIPQNLIENDDCSLRLA
jgi:hypothetical protein